MKVTFIIRNMSPVFFDGTESGSIPGLNSHSDVEKLAYLLKAARGDLGHNITVKIGSGQFRDTVELNLIMKRPSGYAATYKLEPRRGYKLATFSVS